MKQAKHIFFVLLLVVSILTIDVFTDSATGVLSGTVKMDDGTPLGNITIELSAPSLNGKKITYSCKKGKFKFEFLPPDLYSVTFWLKDYGKIIRKEALVRSHGEVEVNVVLALHEDNEQSAFLYLPIL